jgi:hypothetical protein
MILGCHGYWFKFKVGQQHRQQALILSELLPFDDSHFNGIKGKEKPLIGFRE